MNRIIPARAGFTVGSTLNHSPTRDHPRSRGVYFSSLALEAPVPGSSPLARGLLRCLPRLLPARGIIPARAGFTLHCHRHVSPPGDHPRSRGVYRVEFDSVSSPIGSSPLARGLHEGGDDGALPVGIIPARAGFTLSRPLLTAWGRDHPRSRGVYITIRYIDGKWLGSSPLARGLRRRRYGLLRKLRIIPARAGFTRLRQWRL